MSSIALRPYNPREFTDREELRDSIVADAKGRVCGDCQHARLNARGEGWCTRREGIRYAWLAPELAISRRDAVACNSWKAKGV